MQATFISLYVKSNEWHTISSNLYSVNNNNYQDAIFGETGVDISSSFLILLATLTPRCTAFCNGCHELCDCGGLGGYNFSCRFLPGRKRIPIWGQPVSTLNTLFTKWLEREQSVPPVPRKFWAHLFSTQSTSVCWLGTPQLLWTYLLDDSFNVSVSVVDFIVLILVWPLLTWLLLSRNLIYFIGSRQVRISEFVSTHILQDCRWPWVVWLNIPLQRIHSLDLFKLVYGNTLLAW